MTEMPLTEDALRRIIREEFERIAHLPPAPEAAVDIPTMAQLLSVSMDTVYSRVRTGEIPGFKVGGVWRFYPSEVRAHLNKPVDPLAAVRSLTSSLAAR